MPSPAEPTRLRQILATFDRSWVSLPVGAIVAGGVVLAAPIPIDMAWMLAITVFCISLWIGNPVPPWFTALIGIGLIGVTFSTDLALVGFRSAATWLIVFGLLIGEATRASGVADLVERWVLQRIPERVTTDPRSLYRYLLITLCFAGLGLAVLIPSALVRVFVLGPIVLSVGELFEGRQPRVGLFLGPLFSTYYGSAGIFTGSLANIIIAGIVESSAGISFGWTEWAVWLGPIMGFGRTLTIIGIAYLLYRPAPEAGLDLEIRDRPSLAVSDTERRMLGFLLLGVAVWATDSLHGLHPLYGALIVVLGAFAPRLGAVDLEVVTDADYSIVFFLGAIFAIAAGLRQTGFTGLAADGILTYLPEDASMPIVLVFVVGLTLVLALFMEGLAVASVITPTLVSFVDGLGLSIKPVAMIEAVTLNTYFFPYQSAVLVAILGLDVVDSRELIRMATLASIATLVILLPMQIAVFTWFF